MKSLKMNIKDSSFSNVIYNYEIARNHFEDKNDFNNEKILTRTVTFQVTEDCNLACTYCYQTNKTSKNLSLDTAKKFIDLLIDNSYDKNSYINIYNTKALIVEFIGGEPLLQIDLIHDIMDYYLYKTISLKHPWSVNYMISMISNGIMYFDKRVQELLNKYKNRLSFSISLDGCKELHDACRVNHDGEGTYDAAVKACKHYMKNFNSMMNTKMTLAPENIMYTYKAIINLIELGYTTIHSNPIYEKGWNVEHSKIYYNELKHIADYIIDNDKELDLRVSLFDQQHFSKISDDDNSNYCGTTGYMLSVNPDGYIYPCLRFMETSLSNIEAYKIGSVDVGIGKQPQHKDKINILDSINRKSQSDDKCINCPIDAGCGWCTAYNYQETGTPDKRVTYICEMHQARSLANVYFWNKVYKKHNLNIHFPISIPKDWALCIISNDEYKMLEELSK